MRSSAGVRHHTLRLFIRSVPDFLPHRSHGATYVVLPKRTPAVGRSHKSRQESGGADLSRRAVEGSAVPRTFPGNVFGRGSCPNQASRLETKGLRQGGSGPAALRPMMPILGVTRTSLARKPSSRICRLDFGEVKSYVVTVPGYPEGLAEPPWPGGQYSDAGGV